MSSTGHGQHMYLFFEKVSPSLKPVISLLVAVTAIGVLNCSILGHSRVLFAASRNNQAPLLFSLISAKFYTPWPAILLLCIWTMLMLLSGELFTLMELVSLFSNILSLCVVLALLYLRWKQPHRDRPYKTVLAVPIIGSLTIVIVFVLSIYQEPYRLGRGLVILAVALPLYIINENWRRMPKSWQRAVDKFTIRVQKTMMVVKSG